MQFKQFLFAFFACSLFFTACKKDDEITTPPIEEAPVEDNTFLIQATLDNGDVIDFSLDECVFNDTLQRSVGSYGTMGLFGNTWNTKGLGTIIFNVDENLVTQQTLKMKLEFKQPETEGEIDATAMQNIMNTEVNTDRSAYLGFEINLETENKNFRNYASEIVDSTQYFIYNHDFNYQITDYEVGYQDNCLEEQAIKLKGHFEGTFYEYEMGDITDSIYVKVPDFEMLLLMD